MKLLLDTHILLWLAWNKKDKLSSQAVELLDNLDNELYISMASLWEISIKSSLGKPDFSIDVEKLIEGAARIGCKILPIEIAHILKLTQLVTVHKDPFDRLLIAQSESEKIHFLTADQLILKYSSPYLINVSGQKNE